MADTKSKGPKLTPEQRKAQRAGNFLRLANARGNKVLNALDVLGNLASPSYAYTPEQITDLFGALADKLRETEAKFAQSAKTERVEQVLVK